MNNDLEVLELWSLVNRLISVLYSNGCISEDDFKEIVGEEPNDDLYQ